MDFKKGLLCAAISTSLLTACGSDSDVTSPEPRSLTDDQKLAAGKFFANEVDQQVMAFSRSAGLFTKSAIDNSGLPLSGESALEDSATLFLQDIQIIEMLVDRFVNEFKKVEPSVELDTDIDFQDEFIDLPEEYAGTAKVTRAGVSDLTVDLAYVVELEGEDTREVNISVTGAYEYVQPEAYGDPAIYKKTLTISGGVQNSELTVSLDNGVVEYVIDEPELDVSSKIKSLSVKAERISALVQLDDGVSEPVSVEAKLDMKLSQPLMYSEQNGRYYEVEEGGSLTVLNNALPIGLTNIIPALVDLQYYQTSPLNIEKIEFEDVKIAVGAPGSEDYVTADQLSFVGTNADTYRTNSNGEAPYETAFTYTISGEEKNVLTLKNSFGSISYEYVENEAYQEEELVPRALIEEAPEPKGFINCSYVEPNIITEHLLEFSGVDCEQSIPVNADNLADWLDGFKSQWVRVPTVGTSSNYRYLYEDIDTESVGETPIYVTSYSATLDNDANPITFEIAANGEFKYGDADPTPYAMTLNHPGSADYQLALTLGEGNGALNASFDSLTSLIQLNSTIDVLGDESQVEFTLDNSKVIEVERLYNDETTEEQENAIRETGMFTYTVGSLTVDGAKVADVNAIIGDQLINANNPNILDSDIALSLQFTDGTYPEGEFFTTVEELAKRYQCQTLVDEEIQTVSILESDSCDGEKIEVIQSQQGVINLRGLLIAFEEAFQPVEVPVLEK